MENQHQQIKGYRDLTQTEIDLMNEGKALAEQVGEYVKKLRGFPATATDGVPRLHGTFTPGSPPTVPSIDQRWVSIGATECQQGFMALIRAIAQPSTF